jgi:hypothetical protein
LGLGQALGVATRFLPRLFVTENTKHLGYEGTMMNEIGSLQELTNKIEAMKQRQISKGFNRQRELLIERLKERLVAKSLIEKTGSVLSLR